MTEKEKNEIFDKLPPDAYDENGEPLWSVETLARAFGMSEEEARWRAATLFASGCAEIRSSCDPGVHRIN